MFRKLITTALILSFSAFAQPLAAQEREYQSGINTKKLYIKPKIATPTTPEKPETAKPMQERGRNGAIPTHQTKTKETATDRVWNKYKELASGENNEQAQTANTPAVPAPKVEKLENKTPQAPQEQAPPTKASGLQNLLKSYQMNKDQQRQMRTKTLRTPKISPTNETLPSNPQ